MKRLLLMLLPAIPFIGFGQTLIPDANFEQELINLGYDNILDGSVITSNIDTVTSLYLWGSNISNLTGIEGFTALTVLDCGGNQLTSFDVSNNIALTDLRCDNTQLTSLDVSNNMALIDLWCRNNQLTSLDVSQNTALIEFHCEYNQLTWLNVSGATVLTYLYCQSNQLTSLDLSTNTALTYLDCSDSKLTSLDVSQNTALVELGCGSNQITSLDVRNGNNMNLFINCFPNPNLTCISVDDSTFSANNWTNIDPQHYFSDNCFLPAATEEHTTSNKLLKTIDILGRERKEIKNEPIFYIYGDGTVEKKIIIE